MRITNNMISKSMLASVNRAREQLAETQSDLATTKKLRKPSDDPSGFSRVSNFHNLIRKNEQYLRNIGQIDARLVATAAAIDAATDKIIKAKELATQAASDTLDADARASMVSQVQEILDSLIEIGNTRHQGKFLFAGTQTVGQAPFSLDGTAVSYNGNDGIIRNKIGEQTEIAINKPGRDIFQPTGGVDVFDALIQFKQALETNDTNALSTSIDQLDGAFKHFLTVSSELGVLQEKLNLTEEFLATKNLQLVEFSSKIEDTDVAEATIQFQDAENALTFAMRSYSELIQTSLLNFIS